MVITGDITQVDLPTGKRSGLAEARGDFVRCARYQHQYVVAA